MIASMQDKARSLSDFFSMRKEKDSGFENQNMNEPLFAASEESSTVQNQSMILKRDITLNMRKIGNYLAAVFIFSMVVLISFLTYRGFNGDYEGKAKSLIFSSGGFVGITLLVSCHEIYMHLTHYYMPDVQKYVVRLLFMVPFYSIQSWLSLCFIDEGVYFESLRDLYEAFVIASFVNLIIELLGGENALADILEDKDAHYGEHPWPVSKVIRPWIMGEHFMFECKYGTLQYVVVKTLTTLLTVVLEPLDLYGYGEFAFNKGYIYITVVLNISQCYALYCLVILYHAVHTDLVTPVNWTPFGKFVCVKGVVFFTWWQSVLIALLEYVGVIKNVAEWDADTVATTIQDYIVVIEMFLFAVAHTWTFSYTEYSARRTGTEDDTIDFERDSYVPQTIRTLNAPMSVGAAFWNSSIPKDTLQDINRFRGGTSGIISEPIGINMNVQNAESI